MKKLLFLLLLIPAFVFAETFTIDDMTIRMSDDWIIFTRDNIKDNPNVQLLGSTPEALEKQMKDYDMYLDGVGKYYNSFVETFIFVKNTQSSKYNLHKLNDKDVLKMGHNIYDKFTPEELSLYNTDRYKYVVSRYTDDVGDHKLYIVDYYTFINGKGYTIKTQSSDPLNNDVLKEIERVILSISFKIDKKYEGNPYNSKYMGPLIGAIVGGVVGLIVALVRRKKV